MKVLNIHTILYYVLFCNIMLNSIVVSVQDEDSYVENIEEAIIEQPASSCAVQQQPKTVKVPYTTSPLYLTSLAQTEKFVYEYLLKYEKQLQQRLEILQRLRTDYENSVLAALDQVEGSPEELGDWLRATLISSHPLLSYRMIRRFSKDFKEFTENIWKSSENELWEALEFLKNKFDWPSQKDLKTITKSLIKLQDTYDFDLNEFTDGVIEDHFVQVGLTARQCLEISETAFEIGEVNAGVEWFQAAHFKRVNGQDNTISMDELTLAREKTYHEFQSIWPKQIFSSHDVFTEAKELLRDDFNRWKWNLTEEHIPINFNALCRGEKLSMYLTCHLENAVDPYHLINPLRIEMYNWNPMIYQVHDFIEAKSNKNWSTIVVPSMVSSATSGDAENGRKTHTSGKLSDNVSPLLSTTTERIDQLSAFYSFQVSTFPSDQYQISAFAVGNHYEPCTECFEVESTPDASNTNRLISTAHIVLYEPEIGGELAFPLLGVAVTPSIGSVIIHNNIDLSGRTDHRSMHGSCPVLIGEKWTATKLIYGVSN